MSLTEGKFLTDEEFKTLQDLLAKFKDPAKSSKTSYRDALLLSLAIKTSGRGVEVLKVTPSDLGQGTVTVPGAKGSNSRTIPLPTDFFRELKDYCEGMNPKAPIFPISTRHFRRIWSQYRPNPKKGSHSMRHTGALKLFLNCQNLKAVQQYLGQKEIKNTMIYLDYSEGTHKLRSRMKGMWTKKLA